MFPIADTIRYAVIALVLIAAVTDIRSRTIPNWLTLAGFIAGVAIHTGAAGWRGLLYSLGGAALAFGVYLILFVLQAMGGGDVKLMAAVGALTGAQNWFILCIFTLILNGIRALVVLMMGGVVGRTFRNAGFILKELAHGRKPYESRPDLSVDSKNAITLPHAVAIAAGALLFLFATADKDLLPPVLR